jgi:hypothetical protein
MTQTLPLINVEDVRAYLPVRSGNDQFNERLQMLITVATQQIEALTRRAFTLQEHTQFFRTIDTARAFYDFGSPTNEDGIYRSARQCRYPLLAPIVDTGTDPVLYYDRAGRFTEDSLVDPALYQIDTDKGVLYTQIETRAAHKGLKLVYTGGFASDEDEDWESLTTTIPADLKLACITQVLHLFTRTTVDNVGMDTDRAQGSKMGSASIPAGKLMVRNGLTPEAAAMCVNYRSLALGLA